MEIIKILWIIIFFFFTLMLIFIWSKITLISNKIKKISTIIDKSDEVSFYGIEDNTEVEQEDNNNNVES